MLEKFRVGVWWPFNFNVSQSPKSLRTLVLDLDLTLDLDLGLSLDNFETCDAVTVCGCWS